MLEKYGNGVFMFFLPQVLDRGAKIELLVDKTENLRYQVCRSYGLNMHYSSMCVYEWRL